MDPISALTGYHAPVRGAGRTAHAPGPRVLVRVGGVVEGKVAGGRNSAAVAPPALIEYLALRAAAQRGSDASITTSLATAVAGGRNSAAVAPPALTEYRALRAAAQRGSDASITTSLATAVVAHLAAALGAVSTALDAV
ncbi:hypothetical protein EMIHUDRAFT_198374 [Emiliania huxleyi CCMP1516]|uniref:Uncharacterized protein n=2 Tax=Emiliania huxleyi TaxID=2903 RepID=A0A0D3I757_EMIH1|nr:hypothetical protein EMIHUDRAFT_198374 [Emiliania huxleyi CCMP1516]EOD07092.1 hypothetical protein EMIHUDRAFT_198374 [Emiliania huxleyi CCMP1516]|eukprot:XP_005759521.1 hypothetical protein EMIHUDRAFT_198374 [Emiliania huxleyi CCMP1516]